MNGFSYTLILEEPVLASSQSGDTNSARSLPYVPGGLVRGALIGAYLKGQPVDAANQDFQRLFLNGSVRYLHAYPEHPELEKGKNRALPAPLSWKTYKHSIGEPVVFDFAIARQADPNNKSAIKSAPFEFYWLKEETIQSLEPEFQVNVHTQRDAIFGRARGDGQGAVYRYEALPAGMRLKGMVLVDNPADLPCVENLLKTSCLLLGKARTAGYGAARLEEIEPLKQDWQENPFIQAPSGKVKRFILEFLSDAIVRDAAGQFSLDPLPEISARLSIPVTVSDDGIFRKTEVIGSFNRSWGLPLPQVQAIAAGSVFVIESRQEILAEKLISLEKTGLGERTAEGFGRVSISVNLPEHYTWETAKIIWKDTVEKTTPSASDQQVAQVMLRRLLRRNLDERLMGAALDAIKDYQPGSIPNSQLSRWRVILRSAIGQNDPAEKKLARIKLFYLKEDKRNSAAWQKMERAKVTFDKESLRLSEWMGALINSPGSVWGQLEYKKSPTEKIGSFSLQADQELEVEYALRLMDAILASLAKKNAENGGLNGR